MGKLYQCTCLGCTVGLPHLSATEQPLFTDDELDAFIKKVYKDAFRDGSLDLKRASKYAAHFAAAITQGYGKSLADVDYDTPDAAMLRSLHDNVFHFSCAKTRAEIISLSSALRTDEGKLRSFADFRREAARISGEFTGAWLRTEYDAAVGAATTAARWTEYPDEAILTYRTVGDARVREAHRALDGISKPKADPFWNVYYPPNGWNCRCDVQETTSGRITPGEAPAGAIDGVPPMWRVNLAKEGLAFPKHHPYWQAMTPAANAQVKQAGTLRMIPHQQYRNGGRVTVNAGVDKLAADYQANIRTAELIAEQYGLEVELLPELQQGNPLREVLLPGVRQHKNPDYRIGGVYADAKDVTEASTLDNLRSHIRDCLKQGDIAVIRLSDNPPDHLLYQAAYSKLKGEKRLQEVLFETASGKLYRFKKSKPA